MNLMEKHTRRAFGVVGGQGGRFGNQLSNSVLAPTAVRKCLRHIGRQFRKGRQEDAHEFYVELVDKLQRSCLRLAVISPLTNQVFSLRSSILY